jgi:putative transposase
VYITYRYRIYPTVDQKMEIEKKFKLARESYNQLVIWDQKKSNLGSYPDHNKEKNKNALADRGNNRPSPMPPIGASCDHLIDDLLPDDNRYDLIDRSIVLKVVRRYSKTRKTAKALGKKLHLKPDSISHQSFCIYAREQAVRITDRTIETRLLGVLKASITRKPVGRFIELTFVKSSTGKYAVHVHAKKADSKRTLVKTLNKKSIRIVGIDMGISYFITLSDGTQVDNPRFYEQDLKRVQREHRKLSRMQQGSRNWKKQCIKLARLYERIRNQRNGFLHMLSSQLIRQYDIIAIESLSIQKLMHRNPLARKIADAAWRKFIFMLQYKANWYGKIIIKTPRYLPSSKQCCRCRYANKTLVLSDRSWTCPQCGIHHERDINAAINILIAGTQHVMKKWPTLDPSVLKPALSDRR